MDFRESAIASQKAEETDEPDWVEIHIDPSDPETGKEAPPVKAYLPTNEQIAIYMSIFAEGAAKVKAPQFYKATFELLQDVCADDGYERLMEKFRDRDEKDWTIKRLQEILRGLIQARTGRPTEPSTDSSATSEVAGRSSTVTSPPRGSRRSPSRQAASGT